MTSARYVAVSIGNTRTQVALISDSESFNVMTIDNADRAALIAAVLDRSRELSEGSAPLIIASVNEGIANDLSSAFGDQVGAQQYWIGRDLPPPVTTRLDPETLTGVDRLLNAAAAFDVIKQACVIVDAGTAVTVDFIDGKGTFHGGAIAPGAQMQLQAMHEHTSALPSISFRKPADDDFGRSTAQAMLQGVCQGIRGLVWRLVEQYALAYDAYPPVVATGGDALTLFENDELIDRIVPDLTLRGIVCTVDRALGEKPGSSLGGE